MIIWGVISDKCGLISIFTDNFSRQFMSASLWLPGLLVMACHKESLLCNCCRTGLRFGAMIIGLIRHLQKQGMTNLGGKLAILATDIDNLCVNMAYLQLGILGLSVRITHGNSLTDEVWDAFDTPNLQINTCLGYFK